MRIVIDMQGAQTESRFRGIGRYTLSFVKAVVRNRSEHEVLLVLSGLFPDTIESIRAEFDELLPQENIRVWHAPGPVKESESGNEVNRQVAELIREAFLVSLQPDVVHITSLFEGHVDDAVTSIGLFDTSTPVTAILFDLIPLLNSEQYLKPNPRFADYYHRKLQHLLQARKLFAISEFTRSEGVTNLNITDDRVINISTAIESSFNSIVVSDGAELYLRQKLGLIHPFILYAGGADDRKNLPRLIQAFSKLPARLKNNYQLVFAGRMPDGSVTDLKKVAETAGLDQGSLLFTGYLTDDELASLYKLSKLFVFPSWHEGFGLPALEAMACGAIVIGANTSSLPEVIGLQEALFDPFDVNAIAAKMSQALVDEPFRTRLYDHGIKQSKKFCWETTAKRSWGAWEDLSKTKALKAIDTISLEYKLINGLKSFLSLSKDKQLVNISKSIAQNLISGVERQLLIDVSELSQRDSATGVQRVVRSYLFNLLNNPPGGFRVLPVYASQTDTYRYASVFCAQLTNQDTTKIIDQPIRWQRGDIFFGLDMQHHVQLLHAETYAQMRKDGVLVKFLVHDLLPIQLADCFKDSNAKELHEQWLKMIALQDEAICVSRATADAYRDWLDNHKIPQSGTFDIDWVHSGSDLEGSKPSVGMPIDAKKTLEILHSRVSFISVSTLEPRKAQTQILDAIELLWADGYDVNIVFVGQQGWKIDSLVERLSNHSEKDKRLFWLKGISDEYLELVYKASTCLVAASINEGFGLPLIEAARYGKSIIARDIPVFREVAGNSAYYFNGNTAKQLAVAISDWLELQKKGQAPSSEEINFSTWKQSVDKLKKSLITRKYRCRQLFVDISELVQRDAKSGIQRVVRSLLNEWLNNLDESMRIEPIYATQIDGYRYARSFVNKLTGNFSQDISDDYIEYAPGDVFLGLDLAPAVVPGKKSFYEEMQRNGVLVSFVVYDLLPLMPGYFEKAHAEACTRWLDVATSGRAAFCISKSVADELIEWMKNNKPEKLTRFKVKYFHLGADIENSVPTDGTPQSGKYVLEKISQKPSFLMVSTIAPHKGYQQVVAAFEQMWHKGIDINLVIVGKQGWLVEKLIEKLKNHSEINKHLFWLNDVSDEYLGKIYKESTCLLAAAHGEGFGLPLIEAAQHKLPIIARDIPVFREVGGNNVFYFKADSPEDLVLSIEKWLVLYANDQHPKSHFVNWLTWKESASQLMSAINSVD